MDAAFLLKDKDHEFLLPLTEVLECVVFAALDGELPKLPENWCAKIEDTYCIDLSSQ